MSRFTEWSRKAAASPTIWTPPKPRVRVVVRLLAAIAGQHNVRIEAGEPAATVAINRTTIRFPDPLDEVGQPTAACRAFLIETIQDAVRRDRYLRWILWPDETTTACTSAASIPATTSTSSPFASKPGLVITGQVLDRSNVIEFPRRH